MFIINSLITHNLINSRLLYIFFNIYILNIVLTYFFIIYLTKYYLNYAFLVKYPGLDVPPSTLA